jgi:hypothetical protein
MTDMTKMAIVAVMLMLLATPAFADSTQQYNKIFLSPFYRTTLPNNANASFVVDVNPPDKIAEVKSAIVTFQVYSSGQTVTYYLWVNNKSCSTPSFVVTTSVSGAGMRILNFDCSNIIAHSGTYNIVLRPSGATEGATTGWLDLTYMNNPSGSMAFHGTEYVYGQEATAWLQLLDASNNIIANSLCYLSVYNPSSSKIIDRATMQYVNDGIYSYKFDVPLVQGVYPMVAECYVGINITSQFVNATDYAMNNGTYVSGNISDTISIDGNYLTLRENAIIPRRLDFNVTFGNMCEPSMLEMNGITMSFSGTWNSAANDNIVMYVWNYTSSSWLALPNLVMDSASFQTVSNSLTGISNLSVSGLMQNSIVKLRFYDSNVTDGTANNILIDRLYVSCDITKTLEWQIVRGSSEMHVTDTGENYVIEKNAEYFQPSALAEGVIINNFTIASASYVNITENVEYAMYHGFPCLSAMNLSRKNESAGIYYPVSFSTRYDSLTDTCYVILSEELVLYGTNDYSLVMENFYVLEAEGNWITMRLQNDLIGTECIAYIGYMGLPYPNATTPYLVDSGNNIYDTCVYYLIDYGYAENFHAALQYMSVMDASSMRSYENLYSLFNLISEEIFKIYGIFSSGVTMYQVSYIADDALLESLGLNASQYRMFKEMAIGNNIYWMLQGHNQSVMNGLGNLASLITNLDSSLSTKIGEVSMNLTAVNQSVMFGLYNIQTSLDEMNTTLWIVNSSLNISIPTELSLTNESLALVGEEVIVSMLQNARILNDRVVNFHNHQYCIDNMTLQHNVTYDYCVGSKCDTMMDIMNEICSYGCDYENNLCKASPFMTVMVAVIIMIITGIVIYLVWRFV